MLVICMGIKLCMIVWRQLWALSRTRGVSVNAEVALYAVLGTYHLHCQVYSNPSLEARLVSRLVKVNPRPLTLMTIRTDITNKAGFLAWLISTEPEAALAVPQDQEQEEMKQVDW